MKKILILCAIICAVFTLAACGGESGNRAAINNQTSVTDVLNAATREEASESVVPSGAGAKVKTDVPIGTIDLDLTKMSSTVVYSEVYNMVTQPGKYKGKVIKMGGACATYTSPDTGITYYACIIKDATACCAQGIEFVLTDDCKMPDDYPKKGDEIEIVGIFDTYMENGMEYGTLRNSSIVSLNLGDNRNK